MKWVLLILVALLVLIQFVPVTRTNPAGDPAQEIDAPIGDILRRSCYDCHSNDTEWPWYAQLAPASWLLAHHVNEGREHLNFSQWNSLSTDRQAHLKQEIRDVVEAGEMPLSSYLLLHPEAELSQEEIDRLTAWAGETGSHEETPSHEETGSREEAPSHDETHSHSESSHD